MLLRKNFFLVWNNLLGYLKAFEIVQIITALLK